MLTQQDKLEQAIQMISHILHTKVNQIVHTKLYELPFSRKDINDILAIVRATLEEDIDDLQEMVYDFDRT